MLYGAGTLCAWGRDPLTEKSGAPPSCSPVQTRTESDRNEIFQHRRSTVSTQLNPYAKEYKPRVTTPQGEGAAGRSQMTSLSQTCNPMRGEHPHPQTLRGGGGGPERFQ